MSARKRTAALAVAVLTLLIGALATAGASSAKPRPYTGHQGQAHCTPLKPPVGGTVTVQGDDFLPNDHVVITLHSKVTQLGSANANANGDFTKDVQLPAGVRGEHKIVLTGTGGSPKDVAFCTVLIGGTGTGGQGTGGDGGGGTSFTGVEVAGIGALGLALIVGGILFVLSARKRRTAGAETD